MKEDIRCFFVFFLPEPDFAAVHERRRLRVSHGGQVAPGQPQSGGAAEQQGLQELPWVPPRHRHLLLAQGKVTGTMWNVVLCLARCSSLADACYR